MRSIMHPPPTVCGQLSMNSITALGAGADRHRHPACPTKGAASAVHPAGAG